MKPLPPSHWAVAKQSSAKATTGICIHDPAIQQLISSLYSADAAARSVVRYARPFRYSGTTNTGGFEASGDRELTMWVVEIPADVVGPRPTDDCAVTGRT